MPWYKDNWTMRIADSPWVEDTALEVEFVVDFLSLDGSERILDLGCGYGRHTLALAERGFQVVGVDITEDYIHQATRKAKACGIPADFICADILSLEIQNEFDVVLNMCDGAIGYFDSEDDNKKVFRVVADALVANGKHLFQVLNRHHAEKHFPKRDWDIGKKAISLVEFDWDHESRRMAYAEYLLHWHKPLEECKRVLDANVRLYSLDELITILDGVGLVFLDVSSSLTSRMPFQSDDLIMVVQSQKEA